MALIAISSAEHARAGHWQIRLGVLSCGKDKLGGSGVLSCGKDKLKDKLGGSGVLSYGKDKLGGSGVRQYM